MQVRPATLPQLSTLYTTINSLHVGPKDPGLAFDCPRLYKRFLLNPTVNSILVNFVTQIGAT